MSLVAGKQLATGNINAAGAASLSGQSLALGGVEAASLLAMATNGAVSGGNVAVSGAATIRAANGTVDLGRITTGRETC